MDGHHQKIGKYTLLEVLGEGASARVYRAIHAGPMGFRKQVAVKQILPHVLENESAIQGLINEARLGGFLHHRNLVEIYEFNQVEDTFFIAMEFVPGHTLAAVLRRVRLQGPLPPQVIADLAVQLCEGLGYAHAARDENGQPLNLIHRDLKPGNVMITPHGTLKVMDFGVAKSAANLYHTQVANITRGTPAYMSPEQVRGMALDGRSDIFALGSLLTEAVTGQVLFFDHNLNAVLHKVYAADISEAMPLVERHMPTIAPILTRALARERDNRYGTTVEMARDLRRACGPLMGDDALGAWLVEWMGGPGTTLEEADDSEEAPTLVEVPSRRNLAAPGDELEGDDEPSTVKRTPRDLDDEARTTEPEARIAIPDPKPAPAGPRLRARYAEKTLVSTPLTATVRIPGAADDRADLEILMLDVPPGTHWMGARADQAETLADEFLHRVELTRPWQIAATLVTQAQWTHVMGDNPSWAHGDDLPVESLSWFAAVEFCNRLSTALGLPKAYRVADREVDWDADAGGFRLATEAEWEVAARGGEQHLYAGSDDADAVAWYWGNTGGLTQPVGRKKPNALGLYDMCGNVSEWVWDRYGAYPTASSSRDPAGPDEGDAGVCRGGSAFVLPAEMRVTCRGPQVNRAQGYHFLGFRIARTMLEG
jgi:formylglycine-generating enzyme required for sulfatase activity